MGGRVELRLAQTAKIGSLVDVQASDDPEGLRVFYYLIQDLRVRPGRVSVRPSANVHGRSLSSRSSPCISASSACSARPSCLVNVLTLAQAGAPLRSSHARPTVAHSSADQLALTKKGRTSAVVTIRASLYSLHPALAGVLSTERTPYQSRRGQCTPL